MSKRLIVAMPTRGAVCIETVIALRENLDGYALDLAYAARRPVADARNELARSLRGNPVATVLWCDDDAWWPAGTIAHMHDLLKRRPEIDVLSGWYGSRVAHFQAAAYGSDRTALSGAGRPDANLVEAAYVGFHFVMHRTALLDRIGDDPFAPASADDAAEDFAFCDRARASGARIFVATHLPIAHVEASSGRAYLPERAAGKIVDNAFVPGKEEGS